MPGTAWVARSGPGGGPAQSRRGPGGDPRRSAARVGRGRSHRRHRRWRGPSARCPAPGVDPVAAGPASAAGVPPQAGWRPWAAAPAPARPTAPPARGHRRTGDQRAPGRRAGGGGCRGRESARWRRCRPDGSPVVPPASGWWARCSPPPVPSRRGLGAPAAAGRRVPGPAVRPGCCGRPSAWPARGGQRARSRK